jgi:hypothetical protein
MTWRSTVMILVAFLGAGLAVWFAPFGPVGQIVVPFVVLSLLEVAFNRLEHAIGPAETPPPDR